jgi:dolichol-phosphate mannosyltransferase
MNKDLVFTATYNEYPNIKYLFKKIKDLKINLDILIIDDNSSDGTREFLKNYKNINKNIFLIIRKKKLGLDTAHKSAFQFAKKNKYKNIITMDADLSHDPKLIPYFLKKLKTKKFVIGSRYINGGKSEMKPIRFVVSFLGNKFIKFILNIKSNEFTTSYRGFRMDKMTNIDFSKIKSKGYSFFMETLFLLNKNNINITEIPIHFRDRYYGVSKIPKIEIFRTIFNLFRLKYFNKI